MAELSGWEFRERREQVHIGPAMADAADLAKLIHQVLADYRELAGVPPQAEIPPGAVTVSAAGGVLTVRAEIVERPAGEPEQIGEHQVVIDVALGKAVCLVHGETYQVPHELDRLREREGGSHA